MKRLVVGVLTVIVALAGMLWAGNTVARAEDPIKVEQGLVLVWPEYDSPDVLVIYEAQLASSVSLPADLVFKLPEEPSVVAYVDKDGQLISQDFKSDKVGDGYEVKFQAPTAGFQIEYYYDPMTRTDVQRQFSYVFKADYPTAQLYVSIQEPVGSSDFAVDPKSASPGKDKDGFTYHRYNLPNVQPGQSFVWRVGYTKEDPHPSVQLMQIKGSNSKSDKLPLGWPYIITAAAIAVLAVGAVIYRVGWARSPARARARSTAARRAAAGAKFCTECGANITAGAKFCHECGAQQPARPSKGPGGSE
ncbi:MAG: zinc ribbon domain-containing protein [Chloroflexi bacterium]|nr:zinc ribbon domain-containing protein [Chloroflexota bacterium]